MKKILLAGVGILITTSAIAQEPDPIPAGIAPVSIPYAPGVDVVHYEVEIGLGKGKKQHDKRQTIKERDWSRQKSRIIKNIN